MASAWSPPTPFPPATRSPSAPSRPAKWSCATARPSAAPARPSNPASHVHTHNLAFEELHLDYEFPDREAPRCRARAGAPTFLGYARADGRAGTRNYIAVVAASNCAAHTAETIARSYEGVALPPNVDGVVAFPHGEGCGHSMGPDVDQLRRTLAGVLDHPNVSAAIILGLGCEDQPDRALPGPRSPADDRLVGMTLQSSGGTRATVEAARREIARFIERAAAEQRTEVPASKIVLGLNCGGSDSFSGITANPALGFCSDLLGRIGRTRRARRNPRDLRRRAPPRPARPQPPSGRKTPRLASKTTSNT